MSDSYTKLFASITESTIVSEPVATRWLWVTMLAMANANGEVYGSIPGLARRANLSLQEVETALACFYAPDPYSRTKDHEGRRIEDIDGGWRLLNHAKYAAVRNKEERAEYMREYMRNRRANAGAVNNPVNKGKQELADLTGLATPAPTPTQEEKKEQEPHARDEKSLVVEASILLNARGCRTTPANPNLIAAIAEGVTPQALADLADMHKGKPAGYVIQAARGQLADGARPAPQARGSPADRPSKMVQALAKLEAMKNGKVGRGLVQGGNLDGPANAGFLESG